MRPTTKEFHPAGKEHPIDRLVDDGDTVTLGGTTLTAHVMPGHTKGCLAWSTTLKENGKSYYTFVECSLNGQFLQYARKQGLPGHRRRLPGDLQEGPHVPGGGVGQLARVVLQHGRRSTPSWRSEAREIRIRSSTPRATRLTSTSTRRASRPRWRGNWPSPKAKAEVQAEAEAKAKPTKNPGAGFAAVLTLPGRTESALCRPTPVPTNARAAEEPTDRSHRRP